jgi:hypothetical protein
MTLILKVVGSMLTRGILHSLKRSSAKPIGRSSVARSCEFILDRSKQARPSKVDADTGEEVANEDIVKGYKVDTDTFIEVTKEELENVALESTRTIEIDEFVDRSEIDPRYLIRPYYLRPDGKVGYDAFAVIRETIREIEQGRDRTRGADQSRAHYRARAAGQGLNGNAAALPVRGSVSGRVLTKIRSGHCRFAVTDGMADRTPNFRAS